MVWACFRKGREWLDEKKFMDFEVEAVRPGGRPEKTWSEVVEKYCQNRQTCKKDVVDCRNWRTKDVV